MEFVKGCNFLSFKMSLYGYFAKFDMKIYLKWLL